MSGSLRRLWLVTRREWNQRVKTTAFQVSTLVSILIVLALILVPDMYGGGERERTVGLVGERSAALPSLVGATADQLGLTVRTRAFADEDAARAALRSDDVAVVLVDQRALVWKAEPDDQLRGVVTSAVQVVERQEAIGELGLTPEQAGRLLAPPDLGSTSLEPVTRERTEREGLAFIGLFVLFMAIALYGGFLLVGVVEEKSSRVVEVLLSRLRPTELLAGKILGIGLVGLAQLALMAVVALVALRFSDNTTATTTPSTIAWIVVWFVLGYGFYSVLYATAGSLVSRQEEAQSIQFPISAVLIVAYILSMEAARSPDSLTAVVGSLFPPTAPMVMIVRIAYGTVPWWQIALSITLVLGSIYGMVLLAGRVYAGAVLRIGPRLRLREAWRGSEV
ncbi:MAG TPA: ABC transporter permease [Actinomycetota bacterium]|nr:ABC transporter permease [Actinomycetota bacterium]